jgi:flagellar biosynthesis/type III secretory pathway protein FliH
MLSTAPAALAVAAARLRSGIITADYAPGAIADLIEALAAERRAMAAEIEALKQEATPAAARNAYAAGYRDARVDARHFLTSRGYTDLEDELSAHMRPDFARAGQAAHGAAA